MKKLILLGFLLSLSACAKSKTSFVPSTIEVPSPPVLVIPPDVDVTTECPNLSGPHLSINLVRVEGVITVLVKDSKNGKSCTLILDNENL